MHTYTRTRTRMQHACTSTCASMYVAVQAIVHTHILIHARKLLNPLTSHTLTPTGARASDRITEAVVLDVGGMKCGGCSAAVKRMLVARPDVESAAVNLLTETAAVRFRCVCVCVCVSAQMCVSHCVFTSQLPSAGVGLLHPSVLSLQPC